MASSTAGNLATSTTAAKLVDGDVTAPSLVTITNEDATNGVRVGYANTVSATVGLLIKAGATVLVQLDAGESLWVASVAATPAVSYARSRSMQRSG